MRRRREDLLIFGAPEIGEAEIASVIEVLRSGWLGSGPRVAAFEEAFARYKNTDADRVAAVSSCTAALHLSMVAVDLQPGDEVIVPALTFCATVNAVIHAGAMPVLADVDPRTMNIDPARVEAAITPQTRALMPVHFAGRACDMDALMDIAARHSLLVIEDCAHAIETTHRGRPAGTLGDFGCFSFYVTKNLATGEGGMVLAKDVGRIERIKRLALHGLSTDAWRRYGDRGFVHYDAQECGFKYNMMDLQAAIGLCQLERLEAGWQRRREIWERYQQSFASLAVERPAAFEDHSRHGLHLFTLLIDEAAAGLDRDAFLDRMQGLKIGTGVHYRAIPEHRYYRERFGWRVEDYPNAWRIGRQTISLPLSPRLSDEDVESVIDAVREVVKSR
jgi:dTDP-4-amino-4,6-dideoxygalactose transaminase